jgi:hypothetical protein
MTKIFIFSTQMGSVNIDEFRKFIDFLPNDVIVRTSGSHGLDSLAMEAKCKKEVFIPWQNFNNYKTLSGDENTKIKCPPVTPEALSILDAFVFGKLKEKFKKIDNRLVYGIMGKKLQDPVDYVIINNTSSKELPTTSSALVERIAENEDIPTFNLNYMSIDELKSKINFK